MIDLLTDIDGTLGRTEAEVRTSLGALHAVGPGVRVSFVTGRSLTALGPLSAAIPEGARISPWGGGNALRWARGRYRPVGRLAPVPDGTAAGRGLSWVHVPAAGAFAAAAERIDGRGPGEGPAGHVCVGGYRPLTGPPVGVAHAGLDGTRWDLVAPWPRPRRALLRRMRREGAAWIAYWGDAEVDAQVIGEADLVLAPAGSPLAQRPGAVPYTSVAEALARTLGAAPAGARR